MTTHTLTLPKALVTLLAGALFGFGLSLATMTQPEVVIGFLRLQDWGLMLVMGGAAGLALLAYKGLPRWLKRPLLGGEFLTQPTPWNRQTLLGSAIFGMGWGLSGVCPGPAIAALGTGNTEVLWALLGIVLGGLVQGLSTRD
ncbi:MAG: YeeE/YedE family protein [Betaproteobacteria bacterium]|nr:YeeE/YedE family protein [Betaproteobacteria bacterium]